MKVASAALPKPPVVALPKASRVSIDVGGVITVSPQGVSVQSWSMHPPNSESPVGSYLNPQMVLFI